VPAESLQRMRGHVAVLPESLGSRASGMRPPSPGAHTSHSHPPLAPPWRGTSGLRKHLESQRGVAEWIGADDRPAGRSGLFSFFEVGRDVSVSGHTPQSSTSPNERSYG
jgi:hypothetical protein